MLFAASSQHRWKEHAAKPATPHFPTNAPPPQSPFLTTQNPLSHFLLVAVLYQSSILALRTWCSIVIAAAMADPAGKCKQPARPSPLAREILPSSTDIEFDHDYDIEVPHSDFCVPETQLPQDEPHAECYENRPDTGELSPRSAALIQRSMSGQKNKSNIEDSMLFARPIMKPQPDRSTDQDSTSFVFCRPTKDSFKVGQATQLGFLSELQGAAPSSINDECGAGNHGTLFATLRNTTDSFTRCTEALSCSKCYVDGGKCRGSTGSRPTQRWS